MNKEEFLKTIENLPKTDSINSISSYNSINIKDLANAVNRFKKVPTYDELLKENKQLKEKYENAVADYETTMSELQELKKQVEEKENIACNWKDSCLENAGKIEKLENQQKEFINYLEDEFTKIQNDIEKEIDNNVKYFKVERRQIITEILQKYKEIIGSDINVGSIGGK